MMTCACLELKHDHAPEQCNRKPVIMGGVCHECRMWKLGNPPASGLSSPPR